MSANLPCLHEYVYVVKIGVTWTQQNLCILSCSAADVRLQYKKFRYNQEVRVKQV